MVKVVNDGILHLLWRLWGHIDPKRRHQFLSLFLLMIFSSFAEIVSIGSTFPFLGALTAPEKIFNYKVLQPYIKWFEISTPADLLLPLTIIFCLAAVFSGCIRLLLLQMTMRLSFATGADLSTEIYRRTLYQPYLTHISRNSSEIIAAVSTKASAVMYQVLTPLLIIISSTVILGVILITLFSVEPLVALATFGGFSLIYAIVSISARRRLKLNSLLISRETTQVIKSLQEGLAGIRDVLIDGSQEIYCLNFQKADLTLRKAQASTQFISNSPKFVMETMGLILISCIAYYLSQGRNGLLGVIPLLGVLALGAQRILPVLQQIYTSWTTIQGSRHLLGDVIKLLEQPLPNSDHLNKSTPISFNRSIDFDDVSFRYGEGLPDIIKNVSLKIPKGSKVGFIGETGSGKSTLIDICMGLLQPSSGIITVDGICIGENNSRNWHSRIAHVPQSIYLSDGTVAENIAFGIPKSKIDIERVRRACLQAQLADAIESWQDGYDTLVGERGIRLSGGQRQRIGIARALYKNADVIIFDEATSALDTQTEYMLMDAINSLSQNLTIIMIAHRVSTLKGCDLIFKVSNGKIECSGSYNAMLGKLQ
jgi:ATP-binding cassette subfamily B protein